MPKNIFSGRVDLPFFGYMFGYRSNGAPPMTPTTKAQLITACSRCHHVMVANVAQPELDPMTSDVSHGICRACEAKTRQEWGISA